MAFFACCSVRWEQTDYSAICINPWIWNFPFVCTSFQNTFQVSLINFTSREKSISHWFIHCWGHLLQYPPLTSKSSHSLLNAWLKSYMANNNNHIIMVQKSITTSWNLYDKQSNTCWKILSAKSWENLISNEEI